MLATLVPEEAPLSDDRVLIAQSVDGNAGAFSELLKRHDDKMRGVVWRLVESRAEMDDILQDAYMKAWRNLAQFRGDAAFSSWLYRVVYTTALDHIKKNSRRRVVPLDALADYAQDDTTDAVADAMALRAALAILPADQLAVVTLVDGQGASYDEVAELLGISPGTVGSRLSRARATLRNQLRNGHDADGGRS